MHVFQLLTVITESPVSSSRLPDCSYSPNVGADWSGGGFFWCPRATPLQATRLHWHAAEASASAVCQLVPVAPGTGSFFHRPFYSIGQRTATPCLSHLSTMPQIVIMGAGVGGIAFAIALRRQLKFDDFVIYEKASDVGGTWRDNIYPGASSDVPVHFYSLSTDLNPDWPSTHGSQEQTQDYWRKLTTQYDLFPRITFNRQVVSAEWSAEEQLWHIQTKDVVSGESFSTTAKILVSAIGLLEVPRFPDIPGISSFKGEMFHSARWDTGVDLRGKRVAVIGNGASATQFVPLISEDPSVQITEFCRTPNWFLPPMRTDYSALWKLTFRHVPGWIRVYRNTLAVRSELLYMLVFANKTIRKWLTPMASKYIVETAPKEDLEHLVPNYSMGCKRLIFDTNYLSALHRPNLTLNWDGIQSICDDGIITNTGHKLAFDVMIFATGFTADTYPLHVVGDTGKSVQEYYDSQGGPKAYLGTTIPGFPNLFLLAGPNTTTGHTSVIWTEEIQTAYILQFVKPILAGLVSSVCVTPRATDAYNALIHTRLAHSVWLDCVSWYRTGGEGKVSGIFPGPMTLFACWMRRVRWGDYEVSLGKGRDAERRWGRKVRGEWWGEWFNPGYYVSRVVEFVVLCVSG